MIVVPAVDVRGGRVVRLRAGRLEHETVYGADPAEAARRWEDEGAERLHVVDLDAAIGGAPQFDALGVAHGGGHDPGRGGRRPARARRTRCAIATAARTA